MSIGETLLETAIAHHQLGRIDLAEPIYREILALHPQHAAAWHLLGVVMHQAGRLDRASEYIARSIALDASDPMKFSNLGEVYRAAGRLPEAESSLRQALALAPQYAEAYYKLGLVLRDAGQSAAAMECFLETVKLDPMHAAAYNNLGCELKNQGRHREAVTAFTECLRRQGGLAIAHNNLGAAYAALELVDLAADSFRQAVKLDPRLLEAHSNLLLSLNYDPTLPQSTLVAEHREWGSRLPLFPQPPPLNDRNPDRPLRVGYVSRDFYRHPIGYFMEPILANHAPEQVQAHCYSDRAQPDEITARLQSHGAVWRQTVGMSDDALAALVREDQIDILVDLAGHTSFNRLQVFARRAAPVQVTYLGYPNTTGLAAMDYRLTTDVADPPGEPPLHTEQLIRLPRTFCCYQAPPDAPEVSPLPALTTGRVTFGALHNLSKLNATTLDLWRVVLDMVPNSRLLVVRHTIEDEVREWLQKAFAARGMRDRVEFSNNLPPGKQHLRLYHEIDISLDATPWSGHTTSCESLWMGVPTVTLRGKRHAGRMVASVLEAVGHGEWIAEHSRQYGLIAANLAKELPRLAEIRASLRGEVAASPLCDGAGFTREIEKAYRTMWRAWCGRIPLGVNSPGAE